MNGPGRSVARRNLPPAAVFLGLLMLMDLVFIVVDLFGNIVGLLPSGDLRLATDRGHPEYYQYTKLLWAFALSGLAARAMHSWRVLAWSPVILYLLADDSIGVHETLGGWLANTLGLPGILGLRPGDLGELLVTGAALVVLTSAVAVAWIKAGPEVRALFRDMTLALALLGLFGVALDMVHVWFENRAWLLFSLVEDGGEMLTVSMLTAILFHAGTTGSSVDIFQRSHPEAGNPEAHP